MSEEFSKFGIINGFTAYPLPIAGANLGIPNIIRIEHITVFNGTAVQKYLQFFVSTVLTYEIALLPNKTEFIPFPESSPLEIGALVDGVDIIGSSTPFTNTPLITEDLGVCIKFRHVTPFT